MNSILGPVRRTGNAVFSQRLLRNFSGLTDTVFVQLDVPAGASVLTTLATSRHVSAASMQQGFAKQSPGTMVSCCQIGCDEAEFSRLALSAGLPFENPVQSGCVWRMFRCRFDSGVEDHLALLLGADAEAKATLGFLTAIWPILREDCITDLNETKAEVCDQAMLWMIASKIDVAILVMNAAGLMLRANAAAKTLLDQGTVFRRTPNGLRCANDIQTRVFHKALAACISSNPSETSSVVFLDSTTAGLRVPVTMSRFWHEGSATELVTVMMPSPPDSRRVEMLARAVGLTPAEARVAALLQMGLSNKDAARIAGLKEQSVSTYAKRVLNKLGVTSRAEMAQMLTWQAAGGRVL